MGFRPGGGYPFNPNMESITTMQIIIDKLNEEKATLLATVASNEEALANLDTRRTQLLDENDSAEESVTAIEAAVAVLDGKKRRRRKK